MDGMDQGHPGYSRQKTELLSDGRNVHIHCPRRAARMSPKIRKEGVTGNGVTHICHQHLENNVLLKGEGNIFTRPFQGSLGQMKSLGKGQKGLPVHGTIEPKQELHRIPRFFEEIIASGGEGRRKVVH